MIKLANLFEDGCVLQQGKRTKLWGTASPGAKVRLCLNTGTGTDHSAPSCTEDNSGKPEESACTDDSGREEDPFCADDSGMKEGRSGKWEASSCADDSGKWEAFLENLPAGGPFRLEAEEDGENRVVRRKVYVGEVWLCAGQSNMELPMERVQSRFPKEWERPANPYLRQFKAKERYIFGRTEPARWKAAPCAGARAASRFGESGQVTEDEPLSGGWTACSRETLAEFSALAYFYGRCVQDALHVPVGVLNVSKGGSRIEAWLPESALSDRPDLLEAIDTDGLREADGPARFLAREEEHCALWRQKLRELEEDAQTAQSQEEAAESSWKTLPVPCFLSDAGLAGFNGSLLLKKRFLLPASAAGKPGLLILGTMVDSDETYINGKKVGETGYQYPPRRYPVPENLLREGENEVAVRLTVSAGKGRLTPGKRFCLTAGEVCVDLSGEWKYRILAQCGPAPEMDFLCRKASGIYNGMLSACLGYTMRGALWYQGESNDFRPDDYEELLHRLISVIRAENGEELPFLIVQLPDFAIDLDPVHSGWPEIREAQRRTAEALPETALVVTLGLGEDNDLHPLNKKGVAKRAFRAAASAAYGLPDAPAPEPVFARREGASVRVRFAAEVTVRDPEAAGQSGFLNCESGAKRRIQEPETGQPAVSVYGGYTAEAPSSEPAGKTVREPAGALLCREFELSGADGVWHKAACRLQGADAVLTSPEAEEPYAVRYAWCSAPSRGLLRSRDGIMVSPFCMRCSPF